MSGASQIQVDCPKCLASIQVPADQGGTRLACPKCQHSLLVPLAQTAGNSIFDDLFDSPAEAPVAEEPIHQLPGTPDVATEAAIPLPEADTPDPSSVAEAPSGEELSLSPLDDSLFDDIDHALQEHQTSGTEPEAVAPPAVTRPEPPEQPAVPAVETLHEEIELPEADESSASSLPVPDADEPEADSSEPVGSDLDVDLEDGGLTLDDNFSLEEHLNVEELDLDDAPSESKDDPFQEEPLEPLKIDGISPTVKADDIFGVKCKICDTRIHVTTDQAGETIECPICYSEVLVELPTTNKLDPNAPAENAELRLQPAIEAEPSQLEIPDVPTESPSEPLDGDPAETSQIDSTHADDDGLQLAPLEMSEPSDVGLSLETRDLLSPKPKKKEPEKEKLFDDVDASAATLNSPKTKSEDDSQSDSQAKSPSQTKKKRKKKEADPEYGSKDYWQSKVTEAAEDEDPVPQILLDEFLAPGTVISWLSKNFTSPDLIFRTLIAIVMFAVTFTMFDIFHNTYNGEDVAYFNKILGTVFPTLIGGVTLALGTLVLFTTCSMVFQNSASGVATTEEWPGFSFSDWLGPLLFFTVSFWLACLPGGLIGAVIAMAAESNTWIVVGASFTAFLFSPLLFTSACYTGSAFGIVSKDVVKSFGFDQVHWLYYLPYVVALWFVFLIGTLILHLPTFIFSGVGAMIQVVIMICFASVAGLHAGRIVTKLQKR